MYLLTFEQMLNASLIAEAEKDDTTSDSIKIEYTYEMSNRVAIGAGAGLGSFIGIIIREMHQNITIQLSN